MNNLPPFVSSYLRDNVAQQFFPACLHADANGTLRAAFGDLDFYQLADLTAGMALEARLPWLIGIQLGRAPVVLPMLQMQSGNIANIHLLPTSDGSFYILLLDAKDQHANIQVHQQRTNEVQLLNNRLKKVLTELNQAQLELREKNQQIAQVSLLKSQFIASISHEFRTPLTSILGYTEMYQQQQMDQAAKDQMMKSINISALHVLSLVDNILDYARFEAGELCANAHSVLLERTFADIEAIFLPMAQEKGLAFNLTTAANMGTVLVDDVRLRQVVINLCANAIKYTEKGEVRLDVNLDDDLLHVTVTDTGAGIPVAAQQRIFQPFRRLDRDRLSKGAGLGLAISQQILEMLGGGLTLNSKPGVGSVFRVTVPITRLDQPAHHAHTEGTYHILIAEDDADARNIMQLYLQNEPYQVEFVSNGRAAVAFALNNNPDLVLMDMYMPLLDGISATAQLRSEGFVAPIIMLSAAVSLSDKTRAMHAGCSGYLQKPLTSDTLVAEIHQYLHPQNHD